MKITYSVRIVNPVKEVLKVTNDIGAAGDFTVKQGKKGFNITGSYVDEQVETKAYTSSYLGETYSLNEKSQLQLGIEDYTLTDISDIFSSLNTLITGSDFIKIRHGFKLTKDLKIDKFVEKSTDVFLIKINRDGLITGVNGKVKPFSNTIILTETLAKTDVLGYFLTSKPLKIDTDNSLFIPNEDLLKLPSGFCKISNNLAVKHVNGLEKKGEHLEFYSSVRDTLTFSSFVLVDGVKTSKYTIRENEKILIETYDAHASLDFKNIEDNITIIYEVDSQNTLIPTLALVGKDVDLEYSTDTTLYDTLKLADSEFLKKYIKKEYTITLKTTNNENTIINSDVLKVLTDTTDFEGKILKI